MTSDCSDLTRRKHRSSSPDVNDSEEAPKRRKHHHHRKHRHHRHHHRSKKHDVIEDATAVVDMEGKELPPQEGLNGDHSGRNDAVVAAEVVGTAVNGSSLGIDYDMEEGEIIEEDEGGAAEHGDVSFDNSSTGRAVSQKGENSSSCLPLEDNLDQEIRKSRPLAVDMDNWKDSKSSERKENNGVDRERSKAETFVDEHGCRNNSYDVVSDMKNVGSSLSSESGGKKHRGLSRSPSQDRHHNEHSSRNLEKSPTHSRGRSRSRSANRDVNTSKQLDHAYRSNRKPGSDSDNERATDHQRNYRHRSRDYLRDNDRDRSPSDIRHMSQSDMHYSRETHGRVREGSIDMRRDRSLERKREREKSRERERERDGDGDRDRVRNRDRDRNGDRERDRDRDKDKESKRRKDRSREDRVRRERENESNRYSDRDKNRDIENVRDSRHRRYDVGYGNRDSYDDPRIRRHGEPNGRERVRQSYAEKTDVSREFSSGKGHEKTRSDEDEQEDYQDRIALQLANQEDDDLEKIKEESRRRREAILVKYNGKKLQQKSENQVEDKDPSEQSSGIGSAVDGVSENADARVEGSDDCDADLLFSVGKSPQSNMAAIQRHSETVGLGAGTPKSERSDDMFCDDIFGESPAGVRKTGKGDGFVLEKTSLHDNWDDAEGYYSYRFGEILDNRYEIIAAHGKGVFSTVIKAKDLKAKSGDPEEVAIKIIRSNDTMYKAGMDEMVILKKLVGADPENKRHCVRFLSNFKYRNHLCLVFESLHMNLREVLKKFGRNIGLKLTAVRAYAKQLFIALKHLRNCGVLHCDIKPDNMLVNEAKNVLKLCDFGNAMFAGKNEITPYLVSRFYRAPEIILGLSYDHPMDMWSVGCCLFELFTGKVLFPGPSNNDMLRLHMELKGPFPKKMLRKGAFTVHHFDQDLNFLATEEDPVTKKAIKRLMLNVKPKDVGTLIVSSGEDPKMLANFKDLLEKIFVLDPEKRIIVSQALNHPFITGK